MKKNYLTFLTSLLIVTFLFSCKKESIRLIEKVKLDSSLMVLTHGQIDTLSSTPGKTTKTVALRPPSDLGYLGHIRSFGTTYTIGIARNGPPRVLKGWKLLSVPGGSVFASGSLDIRESISGNPLIDLGSVNNLPTGSYEVQVSYSETFAGGGGWWPTPGGIIYSSESYVQAYNTGARINVYSYWNNGTHDHFYSRIKTYYPEGYVLEENGGFQAISPGYANGTIPMYRYWNNGATDHFYTINSGNFNGYAYEGIEFNVFPSALSGTIPSYFPLYRYWTAAGEDHYYTKTKASYSGYVYEGIEGYVF